MTWTPWQFFLVAIAGWMNRQQQDVISYLREVRRILREKLGHKRIILNDAQKRRLATAAKKVGRDLLRQCGTLFSPERCRSTVRKAHVREAHTQRAEGA
ncbi:MAG: hypothetical protein WBF17_21395 [Phycisphaerae bacterium]